MTSDDGDQEDGGMGVVKRRRNRRLLETRRTSERAGVSTTAAAAAWGDHLATQSADGGAAPAVKRTSQPAAPVQSPSAVRTPGSPANPAPANPAPANPAPASPAPASPAPANPAPADEAAPRRRIRAYAARPATSPTSDSARARAPGSTPPAGPLPPAQPSRPPPSKLPTVSTDAARPAPTLPTVEAPVAKPDLTLVAHELAQKHHEREAASHGPRRKRPALVVIGSVLCAASLFLLLIPFVQANAMAGNAARLTEAVTAEALRVADAEPQLQAWIKARQAAPLRELARRQRPQVLSALHAAGFDALTERDLSLRVDFAEDVLVLGVTLRADEDRPISVAMTSAGQQAGRALRVPGAAELFFASPALLALVPLLMVVGVVLLVFGRLRAS